MFTENPQDFISNASIAIHAVSYEGIIVYANSYELEVLGYTKDEYIGRHASEFQVDKVLLSEMMERLGRFETLKNYPAKVKGKTDTKYIIYNSSVYIKDGKFEHTRCYGTEVAEAIYDVFLKVFLLSRVKST
jgi:PAS domain S-box-containing protein